MNKLLSRSASVVLRLILYHGEVYRLAPTGRWIRILRGRAWVTYAAKDILLARGDEAHFASGQGFALVSAVGRTPLVLEILGPESRISSSILSPVLRLATGTRH